MTFTTISYWRLQRIGDFSIRSTVQIKSMIGINDSSYCSSLNENIFHIRIYQSFAWLTSRTEIGVEIGFVNTGELSLSSVTVISTETMLVSLSGVVLVLSATLKACTAIEWLNGYYCLHYSLYLDAYGVSASCLSV